MCSADLLPAIQPAVKIKTAGCTIICYVSFQVLQTILKSGFLPDQLWFPLFNLLFMLMHVCGSLCALITLLLPLCIPNGGAAEPLAPPTSSSLMVAVVHGDAPEILC